MIKIFLVLFLFCLNSAVPVLAEVGQVQEAGTASAVPATELSAEESSKEEDVKKGAIRFQINTRNDASADESEYRLGPGDEISFDVLDEPEYSQKMITVQPDGRISLLGIGVVKVSGLTLPEAIAVARKKLSEILVKPEVSITLNTPRAGNIYLAGEVVKPGMFQISSSNTRSSGLNTTGSEPLARVGLRLTNVLTVSGGVRANADLTRIQIRHRYSEAVETVNLWPLLSGENVDVDPLLQSGDSIYVPTLPSFNLGDEEFKLLLRSTIGPGGFQVRVIGQAVSPGLYTMDGNSPYLNSAIVKAGGFSPQARQDVIVVRRFSGEEKFSDMMVSPDKLDLLLRPNDVVVIPENTTYKSGRFMEQIAKILLPFQTLATTGSATAQTFGLGGWDPQKRLGTSSTKR
jgi:polysaccharide biosynthesis/export protein